MGKSNISGDCFERRSAILRQMNEDLTDCDSRLGTPDRLIDVQRVVNDANTEAAKHNFEIKYGIVHGIIQKDTARATPGTLSVRVVCGHAACQEGAPAAMLIHTEKSAPSLSLP